MVYLGNNYTLTVGELITVANITDLSDTYFVNNSVSICPFQQYFENIVSFSSSIILTSSQPTAHKDNLITIIISVATVGGAVVITTSCYLIFLFYKKFSGKPTKKDETNDIYQKPTEFIVANKVNYLQTTK